MYRIPKDLDLTSIIGKSTTQICVGQFDVMFSFDEMSFGVYSKVIISKGNKVIGSWTPEKWPDSCFYEVMNVKVAQADVLDSQTIRILLENGVAMDLVDDNDMYECLQINTGGKNWII